MAVGVKLAGKVSVTATVPEVGCTAAIRYRDRIPRSSLALDEVPGMTFDDGQIRHRIDRDRSHIIGGIVGGVRFAAHRKPSLYSSPMLVRCSPRLPSR